MKVLLDTNAYSLLMRGHFEYVEGIVGVRVTSPGGFRRSKYRVRSLAATPLAVVGNLNE